MLVNSSVQLVALPPVCAPASSCPEVLSDPKQLQPLGAVVPGVIVRLEAPDTPVHLTFPAQLPPD